MNTILEIKNLSFSYEEERNVLSHINIIIHEGEKIAVVGANGSGKSTLFLNMNGVLQPDGGEIRYRGIPITKKNISDLRKNVGIVFQDADNQIIASTVMQEVSFGPMNLKLAKEEVKERVQQALSFMNLTEFAGRPPHYLSGGEKKRVSIADIIAMKSEVIIFDEPTASLDPVNQKVVEEVLQQLEAEKKTILIATHDVDFAFHWAERILVLGENGILADDTPISIFKDTALLEKAHLRKPTLMEVCEILMEQGVLEAEAAYPNTTDKLRQLLQK